MKIAHAVIENFRHIEPIELDFTDSVGRVKDVSLIVGPNTSGKTSILDALAVCVGLNTELPYARPGFRLNPGIVRKGALFARVSCKLRFSSDEIEATRELVRLSEETWTVPDTPEVEVTWTYPDPSRQHQFGRLEFRPMNWSQILFKGRVKVARLLPTGRVSWNWFERVGGVFTFDQQRTGMSKTIRSDILDIIRGEQIGSDSFERRTSDPRTILLARAIESQIDPVDPDQPDDFALISQRYAEICAPRRIVGPVRDEMGELDLLFANDGGGEYRYDGLSSGEQMLLLFLIKMVTDHVHRSIILVDEIELHQHAIWQRKLLHLLPQIGKDNQIIATSHSRYLRDALRPEAVIELGKLEETSLGEA